MASKSVVRRTFAPKALSKQESADFLVYSNDHHLMDDTITTAHTTEMREWLRLLRKNWPTSLAHTLAIAVPNTQLQFDTVEIRLQNQMELPLDRD